MADDDWDDLSAVWQENTDEIDLKALSKNIRAKALWTQINFTLEIIVCVVGFTWGGLWVVENWPDLPGVVFGAVFLVFSLFGGYTAWWARKGIWGYKAGSALDELKYFRARARSGVRYARINLWSLPIGIPMIAAAIWYRWQAETVDAAQQSKLLLVSGTLTLFFLGVTIWAVWYGRRKKREFEAFDRVISEMEED